ncbi:MAG: GIY-YIG nuclease family protein [Bacteroidales bacterium]|nr:GIY-YIG nuclease family protein [Bacteroidales bacterium]
MEFCFYILCSEKFNKIYIGCTSNLIEKFKSHNELGSKGWTIRFRIRKIIYCGYTDQKLMDYVFKQWVKLLICLFKNKWFI